MAASKRAPDATILPFTKPGLPPEIAGPPSCPKELDRVGKKKWKELVKLLTAVGTLNKIDGDLLRVYCEAFSQYENALAQMKATGGEILKSRKDGMYRNPWIEVVNHSSKELQRLARLLGIDKLGQKRLGMLVKRIGGVSTRDRSKQPPPPQTS